MKLKIAYCRVSTMKQARDGVGIDTQKKNDCRTCFSNKSYKKY